ncbi:hypothetical protein MP228_010478 [Amoeboaphelidium protococcarum]|nr:hypothetical protein MP228_010478 [Amoeboaphelidium protococcarum]
MIDSDDDDDEELPYGYNVLRWKIKFESEEVLASSQLDLITIMFQQYRSNGTSPVQQHTPPRVSLYGYYHDALRQYWLDAMISVINQQCDVVFDEEYEVKFFRTLESSEEIYEDPADFVSLLCLDFGFGSCDYVREQLERRLEIAPSFSALLAYFNLLDLQYLSYNLDLEAYLKSFVINIIKNHECTNMQSSSLELFRINRSKMLIDCNLSLLLERKLSFKWVLKQIGAVKVVRSIDFGWIVLSLMKLYKSAGSGARLCQKIFLSQLSTGRVDEAFNMLVAILSSKQCSELKWDGERMSERAVLTLVEVLVKLLNCQIIVCNLGVFPFAKIFYSFRKVLVDHRQRLILLALVQFSRAHCLKLFQCSSYHAEIKEIVESLGGALEFASVFLKLDANSLSKLSECIYIHVINHFFPSYNQQMLDKISVHMIEQYCQVYSMDLKILAFYFKEFLEHSLYSEVAMLKLGQVLSYDQLKVFCSEFSQDQIVALHLGDQFQEHWIIEVERISKQVGFPENISQIVHLCNLNSNDKQRLPQCAFNAMARVISNIVVRQPEGSTSRYWFFEGLPLSVIKNRRVLRTYIQIWPLASRVSESLRVSAVEELARGLFHYMESNNVVPKVRVQMIKLFQDEAQTASQHALVYEVSRLKEITQCKEVGGIPREE